LKVIINDASVKIVPVKNEELFIESIDDYIIIRSVINKKPEKQIKS
jgi:hypothetical protein